MATSRTKTASGKSRARTTPKTRNPGTTNRRPSSVTKKKTAKKASAKKKVATKKASAKKTSAVRKTTAKKASAKAKVTTKKAAPKASAAKKKTSAKTKVTTKKAATKKASAKTKVAAKKASAKTKVAAKKASAKTKVAAKKTSAKTKVAAKKTSAKTKVTTKRAATKKKTSAKTKVTAKKAATKKTSAKTKVTAKKAATKKTSAKAKVTTKKAAAKKKTSAKAKKLRGQKTRAQAPESSPNEDALAALAQLRFNARAGEEFGEADVELIASLEAGATADMLPALLGALEDDAPHEALWSVFYVAESFDDDYLRALVDAMPSLAQRAPGWAQTALIRVLNTRGEPDDCVEALELAARARGKAKPRKALVGVLRELAAEPEDLTDEQRASIFSTINNLS